MELFERHVDDIGLVLLDLDLPKKPGWVCLEEIRKSQPKTPVLVISGDADRYLNEGHGEHVLRKPFAMNELRQSVAALLVDAAGE